MPDDFDFQPEAESTDTFDFQPDPESSKPFITQQAPPRDSLERAARNFQQGGMATAPVDVGLEPVDIGGTKIMPTKGVQFPRIIAPPEAGKVEKTATGLYNLATGIPNFMLSPEGIITAMAPEVLPARIAGPIIKGLFAGLTAKQAGEALGKASVTGDTQDIVEGVGSAALAGLGALHGSLPERPGAVEGAKTPSDLTEPSIIKPGPLNEPSGGVPEPISEQAPPSVRAGEAQPSAAPVSATVETPVSAGETPQAKAEASTPEPSTQGGTVTEPVTETEIVGLGGAKLGEVPETGAGGEKYGIADRIREERAQAGQVEPVEPGQGINTPDSIARGREIITADPTAPEKALDAFESDPQKNISADGVAAVRAHGEMLAKKARDTESKFGTQSPEYEAARGELSDWDKRSKAMQTEWHKIGMAQQGETDLDTGSFTGLERAYRDKTGNDIPESQVPKAQRIAGENRKAQEAEATASEKLNENLKQVASTTKNPDTKLVWAKANEYLDKNNGLYSFDDIRNKVATDLGMSVDQVTRIMSENKTTKSLADDLWNKQRNARRLKEQAKAWVKDLDTPGYLKFLNSIPRRMFAMKVGLHGLVALGTHAPIVAFDPPFWGAYVKNFGRMYKMVFSPAYYERQMQDLVRSDNYVKARRAGLQNDPFNYEEYHTGLIRGLVKNWLGEKTLDNIDKLTSGGNRGYAVLKTLRQDMFDQQWNAYPDSVKKAQGVAESLANDVNHATGVTEAGALKGSSLAFFAPRLMGSRVMWLAGDPLKATMTFANWKNATAGEKQLAMRQVKEKAWVFATAGSLLALNQGFLSASGSKQKINGVPKTLGGAGFDPLASDFLKFKAAGLDVAYGSAMANMAKLPVRMATAIAFEGKASKLILEDERVYNVALGYLRTQLSPFAGTLADVGFGRDYAGRPLPRKGFGILPGDRDIPKRLRQQGITKPYSWKEYSTEQFTPIPISEGIREVWKGMGLSKQQQDDYLKALIITSIMAGTGSRVTEDTRKK